ncbi:MAG: hypothetical protein IJX87_02565 [Clostridia bacterium]|nr:hypothetical protein [Clostridia bacterium]
MFLRLRILFTILSAICLAVLFPVGTFFGWGWAGMCGLLAALFFGVMLLCKQSQLAQESKQAKEESDVSEKEAGSSQSDDAKTDNESNANEK